MVRTLLAAVIALGIGAFANPAPAYVLEVATSIPIVNAQDKISLADAVQSAVDDILTNAIAFTPTVVSVQRVKVAGDRIYMLLLIADEDGEEIIEAFSAGGAQAE
jgi:hypothetical protein